MPSMLSVVHLSHLEDQMTDETILKLVQSVSSLEAKMENISDGLQEMKADINSLKLAHSEEARDNNKMMKVTWVALGACVGAGGTEALKAFVVALGGM